MPIEDAQRWNNRYQQETRYNRFSQPRPFLRQHLWRLPASGLALDAAMGLGGNAGLLFGARAAGDWGRYLGCGGPTGEAPFTLPCWRCRQT